MNIADKQPVRGYNRRGGRPGLAVDFKAVCDAVREAWAGSGETITDVAARFGVSRGWIHKWVYSVLRDADPLKEVDEVTQEVDTGSRNSGI